MNKAEVAVKDDKTANRKQWEALDKKELEKKRIAKRIVAAIMNDIVYGENFLNYGKTRKRWIAMVKKELEKEG